MMNQEKRKQMGKKLSKIKKQQAEERAIRTATTSKYSEISILESLYLQCADPYEGIYRAIQEVVHATEYWTKTGDGVKDAYRETMRLYDEVAEAQEKLHRLGKAVHSLENVLADKGGDE